MSYEPYATPEYYTDTYGGTLILENDIERALQIASRHIDSLTYNRIVGRGFSSLTQFQRDIIQDVERIHRQRCGDEKRSVCTVVSDRAVLQISEVSYEISMFSTQKALQDGYQLSDGAGRTE